MAQATGYYAELDEIDVDESDLDAEEGIEVGEDVEAWMNEMLAGPADY